MGGTREVGTVLTTIALSVVHLTTGQQTTAASASHHAKVSKRTKGRAVVRVVDRTTTAVRARPRAPLGSSSVAVIGVAAVVNSSAVVEVSTTADSAVTTDVEDVVVIISTVGITTEEVEGNTQDPSQDEGLPSVFLLHYTTCFPPYKEKSSDVHFSATPLIGISLFPIPLRLLNKHQALPPI